MSELVYKNSIGIIGGMGPAASARFEQMLIDILQKQTDQDHPTILHINHGGIPDRSNALLGEGDSPVAEIVRVAKTLERLGARIICMPCNTAHAFFAEVQSQVREAHLMNMVELTADAVADHMMAPTRIGVLATRGMVGAQLYTHALGARELQAVYPDKSHQRLIDSVIAGVKAGQYAESEALMQAVMTHMEEQQACDAFILGCTELSLIAPEEQNRIVIDSLEALAHGVRDVHSVI